MTARTTSTRQAVQGRHLHGPVSDFLALGGISLVLLPLLVLLPAAPLEDGVLAAVLIISIAINNPHFAASYRIFYDDFGVKSRPGNSDDPTLHWRYLSAGIGAPVLLAGGLLGAIAYGEVELLAYGYNVMVFFVGWHYVKQGYGMAMVDAALKRAFFDDAEKRTLRMNSYAAWLTAWIVGNRVSDRDDYNSLPIKLFDIPDWLLIVSAACLVATSIATTRLLVRRALAGRPTPWTGVTAYLVSLYPWIVFVAFDPLVLIVVPVLHSLQYLWVVSRYQRNRAEAAHGSSWTRLYVWSVLAGALMFWIAPLLLDIVVPYNDELGDLAFLFAFWVGINIHHYFIDNVIWRRGNPDVSAYLFA